MFKENLWKNTHNLKKQYEGKGKNEKINAKQTTNHLEMIKSRVRQNSFVYNRFISENLDLIKCQI